MAIEVCEIPDDAMLGRYRRESSPDDADAYVDCYTTTITQAVPLAEFVQAFYTTWLFKVERRLLSMLVDKPSTDEQARQVGEGAIASFAAWNVEDRSVDQLLMCDYSGRTRSWFMVSPMEGDVQPGTRLRFGSAVVPRVNRETGRKEMGGPFSLLLGFHKLYSRALLSAARSRLMKRAT